MIEIVLILVSVGVLLEVYVTGLLVSRLARIPVTARDRISEKRKSR